MPIKVAISGIGKMSQEVLAAVCRDPDLEPVAVVSRSVTEDSIVLPGGSVSVPSFSDPQRLLGTIKPDVLVDFTNADWTPQVSSLAIDAGVRLVIGTSALPDSFIDDLKVRCEEEKLGAVVAANFAVGATLMIYLARIMGRFFDSAEIIEMHHEKKVDAPSATSLATARSLVEGRGGPFEELFSDGAAMAKSRGDKSEGVVIHSVRLPGLVAHQELVLGGPGETLTLRHDTVDRTSFMPGVCLSIREVMKRDELVIGLEKLIGLA